MEEHQINDDPSTAKETSSSGFIESVDYNRMFGHIAHKCCEPDRNKRHAILFLIRWERRRLQSPSEKIAAFFLYKIGIGLEQIHGICSNHQLLIGGDNHYLNLRIIGGNHYFLTASLILFFIELHTQELQSLADFRTHTSLILAYAGGKYDNIHATHGSSISTDILLNTIEVHVQCQLSTFVACIGCILHITHI